MAQQPMHFPIFLLLIFFLSLVEFNVTTSRGVSDSGSTTAVSLGDARPAMVLPLFLSHRNSSGTFLNPRRHLLRSNTSAHANARMRLHDNLLLNGYYTTRLWIGTPPQRFALIVDTGSTVTYVPCSTCEQCGRHQDPKFQPELSSTYRPVKCNIDCNCDSDKVQCVYERQYAEMSTSSGVLGEDIISFGNESELVGQRAVFGCENLETGNLYSQHADGIMGLGQGDLSIVDQLVDKDVISDSFSLCYGGMDSGGGAMVLGGISTPADMVFTYSDPVRSPYYNIDLKEIHVAGKPLPLNPNIFDGKHGTVLDSGTTYAYFPEAAFMAFKDAITKKLHPLKPIRGPDPNYNDICFSDAGSDVSQLSNTFPVVDMVFGNGQKLVLSPENYLFRHSKVRGAYCLGIFQNGKDPTTLLGGIVVRNTLVVYDRENSKIGFWKTNCSELWERLHINGASLPPSPPPPSSLNEKNSTAEMPPTLAPSDQPYYVLQEELHIGKITFEMSLNLNYSNLKLHITELREIIAQDLGINTSQVDLLNLSSKGNDSLIGLAILPSGSADYISNATALRIIARVVEHHMQLPDSFGSYQLIHWMVEPQRKQTWWQQHYLLLVLVVGVVLVTGLSAFGICIIWRRQQTLNAYKPVNAAVSEQELQPL